MGGGDVQIFKNSGATTDPFYNFNLYASCYTIWHDQYADEHMPYILLKAKKQEGVAYRELLANLYQHLLEECLTAGAADMNRPN